MDAAYAGFMQEPETEPTAEPSPEDTGAARASATNSVDATAHQPLVDRVRARTQELEQILAEMPPEATNARGEIETALATVRPMLTGDLAKVPAVVMVDLNRWLERTKHVGESNR